MSILSVNMSTVNTSSIILNLNEPFQIMPVRTGFINLDKFKIAPKSSEPKPILIHTGYDFSPFSINGLNPNSYAVKLLYNNLDLLEKINADYVLIHGPDTTSKLSYFMQGLAFIKQCTLNYYTSKKLPPKFKICIEIPAFKKDLYNTINSLYNDSTLNLKVIQFIKECLNECVKNGFSIVLDTAHLYANGLSTSQQIELLKEYSDYYKYIHLNGNCKNAYEPDEHTILNPNGLKSTFKPNKIPDVSLLLSEISKLNKICISEEKCNNYDYFKNLADTYDFKLVSQKIITNSVHK